MSGQASVIQSDFSATTLLPFSTKLEASLVAQCCCRAMVAQPKQVLFKDSHPIFPSSPFTHPPLSYYSRDADVAESPTNSKQPRSNPLLLTESHARAHSPNIRPRRRIPPQHPRSTSGARGSDRFDGRGLPRLASEALGTVHADVVLASAGAFWGIGWKGVGELCDIVH